MDRCDEKRREAVDEGRRRDEDGIILLDYSNGIPWNMYYVGYPEKKSKLAVFITVRDGIILYTHDQAGYGSDRVFVWYSARDFSAGYFSCYRRSDRIWRWFGSGGVRAGTGSRTRDPDPYDGSVSVSGLVAASFSAAEGGEKGELSVCTVSFDGTDCHTDGLTVSGRQRKRSANVCFTCIDLKSTGLGRSVNGCFADGEKCRAFLDKRKEVFKCVREKRKVVLQDKDG